MDYDCYYSRNFYTKLVNCIYYFSKGFSFFESLLIITKIILEFCSKSFSESNDLSLILN